MTRWLTDHFEIQQTLWQNPDQSQVFYQIFRKEIRHGFEVFSRKISKKDRPDGLYLCWAEKEKAEAILQQGYQFRTLSRPFLTRCVDCGRIPTQDSEKDGVYFHLEGGKVIETVSETDFKEILKIVQEATKEKLAVGDLTPRRFWKVDGKVQLLPDETWGETMTLGMEMEEWLREWELPPLSCRRRRNRYFFQWNKPSFGQIHLFRINRTLPRTLRQQSFWTGTIPAEWDGKIPGSGESCELDLSPHEVERILPILDGGGIGRIGRVFRIGGPEELTLQQHYLDEGDLVLEFQWPEEIYHAILLFRHDRFARGVKDGRVFTHERSNPLLPKRISLKEFQDWPKIYLQIYSRVRTAEGDLFSIGCRAGSRLVIGREEIEE